MVIGTVRMFTGDAEVLPTLFNFIWVGLDLALISVIVQAARYRGFEPGGATSLPATAQAALRNREEVS